MFGKSFYPGFSILSIQESYLPSINGCSIRTSHLFSGIKQKTYYEIFVLTTPKGKSSVKNSGVRGYGHQVINGVNIFRSRSWSHFLKLLIHIIHKYKIDIIYARNPRYALISKITLVSKPIILEIDCLRQINIFKKIFTKVAYHISSSIIVLSKGSRKKIITEFGISSEKINVIYNGVDMEHFSPYKIKERNNSIRQIYNIPKKNLVVGYVGTFWKWQGVYEMVNAIKNVVKNRKDVSFVLVGDGPELKKIYRLITERGLYNKCFFTGKIPPSQVPKYIECMDILVIPRPSTLETETAVPLKLFEAMSMGKAIIATKVGGIEEIIEDGQTGVLVEPGNSEVLAKAIVGLCEDHGLRKRLGHNAREYIVSNDFSWSKASIRLLNVVNMILEKHNK